MKQTKRLVNLLSAVLLLAGVAVQLMPPTLAHASAVEFNGSRSLTLEDQTVGAVTDGGSLPSGTVKHLFSFTISNTTDQLGSITFQYCTTAEPVAGGIGCVAPAGINVSGATLSANTGIAFTSGSLATSSLDDASDGTVNVITISRTAATVVSPTASTYEFSSIVNPSAANTTFFVRIATYTSTDGSGSALEGGTVAASTANAIQLSGNMPESLVFCTGATVSETNSVPDCSTATAGDIFFNQLFSPTSTAYATSQMAASTNAGSGYAITVGGPTMRSGTTNKINAMATTDQSKFGISQFGMNLVLNDGSAYTNAPNITSMPVGYANSGNITPVSGDAPASTYHGVPNTGFNTAGSFTFNDQALNTVANSGYDDTQTANLGTPIGTDSQIYTASYIVNVPGSLPAGTYTTTLTYICTPTF
jgi:hypothetical protein